MENQDLNNEKTKNNNQAFSVSMCVYGKDNAEHFKTAVDSILNQTAKPSEVVLVVDGPVPPELDEVILEYEKSEIFNVTRLPENMGHGEARRCGLAKCTNELVAIMDADDISHPDRFEKQLKMFEEDPELAIVGGNMTEFIDTPDNLVAKRIVPSLDADIKEYMKKRCPFTQVTVMFKKSCVEKAGGYLDWFCDEDYYLWIRMYLEGMKFANCEDILVNVRVGRDMYSRRGGWKYFKSEAKLQKYMRKNKIISFGTYFMNVAKRFIVQVLLTNRLRGWVFRKFARKAA